MPAVLASEIGTNKPIYGPGGIIIGYGRSNSAANAAENPNTPDYPIFNGKEYISNATGQPWPKNIPLTPMTLSQKQLAAQVASAGRSYGTETANSGKQPWDLIVTPKMPELNPQIDALTKTQSGVTQDWQKTFQQLQGEELANLKAQTQKTVGALDTSGVAGQLNAANSQYETAGRDYLGQSADVNKKYADETAALLAKNRENTDAMVTGLGQQLDAAQSAASARVKAYQAGSGTPTSSGGAVSNRFIRETTPSRLAYLQNVGNLRRADIGMEQGAARELYGNDRTQLALGNALDQQFRGNTTDTARYLYDVTARASQLQGAQLTDYMNQVIRVMGLGQQMVANDANNLTMLARLKELANNYTYRGQYDPSRIAPSPSFTPAAPTRNYNGGGGDFIPPISANPGDRNSANPGDRNYGGDGQPDYAGMAAANGGFGGGSTALAAQREYDRKTLPAWLFNQRWPSAPLGPTYQDQAFNDLGLNYNQAPGDPGRAYNPDYGTATFPNDYNWGRTDAQQAAFADAQRSYE